MSVAVRLLLAASLVFVVSCEDEEPRPTPGDGAFVELLLLMPDRPEIRAQVQMGDVERAREALGVDVPPEVVDGKFKMDGFVEYMQALVPRVNRVSAPSNQGRSACAAPNFFIARPYTLPFAEVIYASMGISVGQWIMGGDAGQRELHAIRGSSIQVTSALASTRVRNARRARPGTIAAGASMAGALTTKPTRRVDCNRPCSTISGGVDGWPSPRPCSCALFSTADIHAMVDAASGAGSLADNAAFRLAAEGLERLGSWNATITERTFGPAEQQPEGLLRRYGVMAFGERYDGGNRDFVVALVHHTPEDARRLPTRIAPAQRQFAERTASSTGQVVEWDKIISDLDVQTDGRLLLATLRLEDFPGGFLLFLGGLLAHE